MQYLLLIYEDEKALEDRDEQTRGEIMAGYHAFTASVREAGQYIAADALQPTTTATSVRVRDGKTLTTDGPFAETKEHPKLKEFAEDLNKVIFEIRPLK